MTDPFIARWRLRSQLLAGPGLTGPADVVRRLGAVQAQDYVAALLGVGTRVRGGAEAGVERALADREIVRTHFMRNTVHLLPAADLRWMVRLVAPRVRRLIDGVGRANGVALDEGGYARSTDVIAGALAGGRELTRPELAVALERAGVRADPGAVTLLVQRAQVDGLICQAPRRGARYGLVLVDEWLPPGPTLDRDEALAVLAGRYVAGHGPATARDFAWWSGLTLADARAGLIAARPALERHERDGRTYWYAEPPPAPGAEGPRAALLLPNYDEYLVGYTDRSAAFDDAYRPKVQAPSHNVLFANPVVVDGEVIGTWRRAKTGRAVAVSARLFRTPTAGELDAVRAAAQRYAAYLERPVELTHTVG